jgi:hypothetical protein
MRWSKVVVAVLGCGLLSGCQLLVTFESLPEGAGSTGGTGGAPAGGATSAGGTGTGGTGTGGTGTGGTPCLEQCCSPLDCGAPLDPCKIAVCSAGKCIEEPVPEGAAAPAQISGDCKQRVCEGGVAENVEDPTDVLDDANDCTIDQCNDWQPDVDQVQGGTACILAGTPGVCDGKGKCVGCLMDATCPPSTPKCMSDHQVCVPDDCDNNQLDGAETEVDCGGPACAPCDPGKNCNQGSDCASGICDLSGQCANPQCDDGVRNGDESDVDCGGPCPNCNAGQKCDGNGDCEGNHCTGEGGVCLPSCEDQLQNNFESDVDCGGGDCDACRAGKVCAGVDANCLSGDCGPAGTCELGVNGTPCAGEVDCLSTNCTQGVCCDSDCNAGCKSCTLGGSEGTCTNVPAGQDPKNACLNACNGNGACQ